MVLADFMDGRAVAGFTAAPSGVDPSVTRLSSQMMAKVGHLQIDLVHDLVYYFYRVIAHGG